MPPEFRIYIATSLDGYIARADGSVDWLSPYDSEAYGYDAFLATIGTVVMGRKSFDLARSFGEWPYRGKRNVVLTRSPPPADAPPGVTFTHEPVPVLADRLAEASDGDVWLMGGGDVIRQFLAAGRVDSMELFVIPELLGDGIPLFPNGEPVTGLSLTESRAFPTGVVQLRYTVG